MVASNLGLSQPERQREAGEVGIVSRFIPERYKIAKSQMGEVGSTFWIVALNSRSERL